MQQIALSEQLPQPSDPRKMVADVFRVLGVLKRGWKLIVLAMIVCLSLAVVYLTQAKSTATARAQLLVVQQGGRPVNLVSGGELMQPQPSKDLVATHLVIIRSPLVVGRAIESANLAGISIDEVFTNLQAIQHKSSPNVIELSYTGESRDEARDVLEAVIESYKRFLRENYQENAGDVIAMIVQARDDLNEELKSLEAQYLEFRQENAGIAAEQGGRPFISRRLDQWDQTANQAMTRALQLKMQLELAQQLAQEGADVDAIAGAVNQLAGVSGGGSPIAPAGTPTTPIEAGGLAVGGYEQAVAELAVVSDQRQTTELLIKNLIAELQAGAQSRSPDDADLVQRFYAVPEVAALRDELDRVEADRERLGRVVRRSSDPSSRRLDERAKALEQQLTSYWEQLQPQLLHRMDDDGEALRKARAELVTLKAKEAALRERAEQLRSARIASLHEERQRLAEQHGPEHDKVAAVSERIASLERGQQAGNPHAPAGTLIGSLEGSLKAIEAMRAEIETRFEQDLSSSHQAEMMLLKEENLRKNLERQRALFDSVAAQLKQAEFSSNFEGITTQVIQSPSARTDHVSTPFVLLAAMLAGTMLGGGAAFLIDLLDPRIRTLDEMRAVLGQPVLGVIPQLPLPAEQEAGPVRVELLSLHDPRGFLAESYKSTRTNLEFLRRHRAAQVLLVSSPSPGDGKTTTSSNLAISMASAGRRVLLIDGDLRKPSLHEPYDLDPHRGLAQVLGERVPVAEVIQPSGIEHLDVITAGGPVPNPAERLASRRLGELVDEVRPLYDLVIIDSSPLLAVTDPSILSASADALLLVTRIGQCQRQDASRALELTATLGIPVLGTVINGVTRAHVGRYDSYPMSYAPYGRSYGASDMVPALIPPSPADGEVRSV